MKIQKTIGAGVMSLGLIFGMAGFAGAAPVGGSIDTTGPRSDNVIRNRTSHRVDVHNNNDLRVRNNDVQDSLTGNATVRNNTRGGDAWSGHATNENSFRANVSVDNSGSSAAALVPLETSDGDASISDTGPRSDNRIITTVRTNVEVDNDNDLQVQNSNTQFATSGDATVRGNTRGGDASSGDATNVNETSVTFNVTN